VTRAPSHIEVAISAAAGALIGLVLAITAWDSSRFEEWVAFACIVGFAALGACVAVSMLLVRAAAPVAGVVPAGLCAAAFATYACVPETDQFAGVAAALLVVLGVELLARRPLHPVIHGTTAAIVLWAGLYGSDTRLSAAVGAAFAWWTFVLPGAWVGVRRALHRPDASSLAVFGVMALGGVAAFAVARTGAIDPGSRSAVLSVLVAAAVSLGACVLAEVVVTKRRARTTTLDRPA
jgi:hypothetical protein